ADEGIIRLLYLEPELGKSEELPAQEEFSSQVLGRIYSAIRNKIAEGATINTACLGQELSQNEMSLLVSILQKPEILANSRRTLRDYIEKMREQSGNNNSDLLAVLASRQKKEKDLRDKYGR
ncbi:MAG: DNA primase, partial [Oscillospiraceae bacterium]|nr:DNA primase [Oscillospiraceae bacterium]